MYAQDNILCQFGPINLSSVHQLISPSILVHFWWELYQREIKYSLASILVITDRLQCLVEVFLLLEQGKLVLVVAISQQQVLDDLGVELVAVHSSCGKSFAALDDRETHLGNVLSGDLLRLQTSHFLLHVFESFHGVALEGLDEQHPNLQEARFVRDAILNLPFQGLVQAVHEHQVGGSVAGSSIGVILGILDGCC